MRTENVRITGESGAPKLWLAGWGNTEADIMLVISHPTHEDCKAEQLLIAPLDNDDNAYTEITEALESINIDIDTQCWVTAMVKYGIGSRDKPSSEQIAECFKELDEEIAEVKPKIIIAFGSEVFKRLMMQNIKQSDYIGEIIDSPYGKVLVNYAPGQILRVDPTLRPEFQLNFSLAQRSIAGTLKYTDYEYMVVRDPEEHRGIIADIIKNEMFTVGYDLEWKGKFMSDEILYSMQYSVSPDRAIVLPLVTAENPTVENIELLRTMKPLLEHPRVDRLGWNIRADDKRLIAKGVYVDDSTLGFDGMKAIAFFDSRWGKGLEYGIKKYTNYHPYYNQFNQALRKHKLPKHEMSDLLFKDETIFLDYAAGDAVAHREACINMRKSMKKDLPKRVSSYYFDTYLPLTNYLIDMELTGLPIDMTCLKTLTDQYSECYKLLSERLVTQTKKLGFDTEKYNELAYTNDAAALKQLGVYEDFNPRSFIDKSILFYDVLKLPAMYYVRKGKTKPAAWYVKAKPNIQAQFKPSTNGKAIASIRFKLAEQVKENPNDKELLEKYEVVKTYLDLARVSVFSHKFLSTQGVTNELLEAHDEGEDEETTLKSSYWAALGKDNRIYADFYECLDNFRSSSKPNVQNPASKVLSHMPTIFEQLGLESPKNIRNIFYAGDPDWYFAEVDVAGADLAIAAFLSKDPAYIKDILQGGFHTTKMREYFKDPTLSKNEASKYVTAKSITFRVAYTAGLHAADMPIQAEIFSESGHFVDIKLIQHALKTWERYVDYMEYRERCQTQTEHSGYIENARGMKYIFERTSNPSIMAGWKNQSLAYPIASELALFMWDISVKLKQRLIDDGVWLKYVFPVNVVHDANYWVIHKDMMKDGYFPEVCKEYFTDKVRIATGDALGMEMVVADRWKGSEKIFTNETKWNFKTNKWDWDH